MAGYKMLFKSHGKFTKVIHETKNKLINRLHFFKIRISNQESDYIFLIAKKVNQKKMSYIMSCIILVKWLLHIANFKLEF